MRIKTDAFGRLTGVDLEATLKEARPYTYNMGALEEAQATADHAERLVEQLITVLLRRRIITPADLQEIILGREVTNPSYPRWTWAEEEETE